MPNKPMAGKSTFERVKHVDRTEPEDGSRGSELSILYKGLGMEYRAVEEFSGRVEGVR